MITRMLSARGSPRSRGVSRFLLVARYPSSKRNLCFENRIPRWGFACYTAILTEELGNIEG